MLVMTYRNAVVPSAVADALGRFLMGSYMYQQVLDHPRYRMRQWERVIFALTSSSKKFRLCHPL